MTVYELCYLYIEESEDMEIWDGEKEETVFSGMFREAMDSEFSDEEVSSFGIERGKIVININ